MFFESIRKLLAMMHILKWEQFMCFDGLIKDRYSSHIKMTMAVVPNAQLICPQNDQPHLPPCSC